MRVKGLIFDFDGTLADAWMIGNAAFKATYRQFHNSELSDSERMTHAGFTEDAIVARLVSHAADEAIEFFFCEFTRLHGQCQAPFSRIAPLLADLKGSGTRLAIVTAKCERAAEISLGKVQIKHMFEDVYTAVPGKVEKAPRIAALAASWSLTGPQVAYVGDSVSDMLQANEAGVLAIGACWGDTATPGELHQAGAAMVFSKPEQLARWLKSGLEQ